MQLSGGSGKADLYLKSGAWPTTSSFDTSSTGPDTNELAVLSNPPSGWLYVMVAANPSFEQTSLIATIQ